MKINIKKLMFFFVTAGTLSGSYFIQKTHKFESIQNCNQFSEQLEIMEHEVWEELTKIGIIKEKVEELKARDYQTYLQMTARPYKEPVSKKIQDIAIPILIEFNLSPEKIHLIKWDRHIACASDSTLYINEELLSEISEEAQKFTIAHEIQHILNKDHSTDFMIHAFMPNEDLEQELPYEHPLMKYYRFRELRADIQAATKNSYWAQNYLTCMREIFELMEGNTNGPQHPKTSTRIELAQNMVNNMKQETTA